MSQNDEGTAQPFRFNLQDPHVRANADAIYAELHARRPVNRAILTAGEDADGKAFSGALGRDLFLVTGYDEAVDMLGNERFSIDPRWTLTAEQLAQLPPVPEEFRRLSESLPSLDPPSHTRLRRLVQPSFTPRRIEALRPRIQAIADELLDAAEAAATARGETSPDRRTELIDAFAHPLALTVICGMMGVSNEGGTAVRSFVETLQNEAPMSEVYRNGLKAFTAYLHELFAEKRRHPADDLTTELVHIEEEGGDRLSEDELLSMVCVLLAAGHVTTVNLIANGVVTLLAHPNQLTRLKEDPALTKSAVEEILRFQSPVEMAAPRHAREDVELGGALIPKGSCVMPVLAAADRDPAHFPNPHDFDITRSDANRNIAFSRGVHVCIGAPLARVEAQVALSSLFTRMPDLRLEDCATEPVLQPNLFRGLDSLPVLF